MWKTLAIAGATWTALLLVLYHVPKGTGPAPIVGWIMLSGAVVRLRKGVRYRGCLRLPIYVFTHPAVSTVRAKVEERGFRDVVVADARPSSWPDVSCEYFIEATWDGADTDLQRPSEVPFAWEART